MKRILLLAIAAIAFTTLPSFKAPPAIVTDTHFEFPIGGAFNPCNGEFVNLDGTISIDYHTVINGKRVNQSAHLSGHGTGTGDQGNDYVVNINENAHSNFSLVNGSQTYNDVYSFKVISKGGAPNFVYKASFKITVNANGDVTVVRGDSSAECRG